jgi:hypothetical protein
MLNKIKVFSNVYDHLNLICDTIDEQVEKWLESDPNINIVDTKVVSKDSIVVTYNLHTIQTFPFSPFDAVIGGSKINGGDIDIGHLLPLNCDCGTDEVVSQPTGVLY